MSSLLKKNESNLDRGLRVAGGVGLLSLLAVGPVPGWGLVGLVGVVPILTGLVGSCPIYTLFGISTCPVKPQA